MSGEGLPVIGKLLGYTPAQTTATYAHLVRDTYKKTSVSHAGDSIGDPWTRKSNAGTPGGTDLPVGVRPLRHIRELAQRRLP